MNWQWDGERGVQLINQRRPVDQAEPSTAVGRTIARLPGLPTSRAVTGALLVTLAVTGLFVASRRAHEAPGTSYVVLTSRVAAGTRLDASDLTTRRLDLAADVAALVTTDVEGALGAVALETLLPGQLLQTQAILPAGSPEADVGVGVEPEEFEVSFALDRARALGGAIKPGERVDVVATITDGGDACTSAVVRSARVVRVGSDEGNGFSAGSGRITVTLAIVDSREVLGAVFAADRADATIVRSTRAGDAILSGTFCGIGAELPPAAEG